tara:strand:+ start:3711 stop:4121 length:411 start_codon:yes stop_codon:yes gene_type:complete
MTDINQLKQPNHRTLYRLLEKGWIDREGISEKMFLSNHQISCMISVLRNKGINIISKPHPQNINKKTYKLGAENEIQTSRNEGVNRLLVCEMNSIRQKAEARIRDGQFESGIIEIGKQAEKALEACGLINSKTEFH